MTHREILDRYPIISDQIGKPALAMVLAELEKVLGAGIPGDIAEFGCYIGTTSLFIRRLLNEREERREFHVYDSFEGLPPKTIEDASALGTQFKAGELKVSKRQFLREFKRAGLAAPVIHKAWFSELTDKALPEHIAFAFLDGDFYESILESLHLVWPRLDKKGIITVDDYQRETLPGVERAVRDFFQDKSITLHSEHNIGVIKRQG